MVYLAPPTQAMLTKYAENIQHVLTLLSGSRLGTADLFATETFPTFPSTLFSSFVLSTGTSLPFADREANARLFITSLMRNRSLDSQASL